MLTILNGYHKKLVSYSLCNIDFVYISYFIFDFLLLFFFFARWNAIRQSTSVWLYFNSAFAAVSWCSASPPWHYDSTTYCAAAQLFARIWCMVTSGDAWATKSTSYLPWDDTLPSITTWSDTNEWTGTPSDFSGLFIRPWCGWLNSCYSWVCSCGHASLW